MSQPPESRSLNNPKGRARRPQARPFVVDLADLTVSQVGSDRSVGRFQLVDDHGPGQVPPSLVDVSGGVDCTEGSIALRPVRPTLRAHDDAVVELQDGDVG